MNPIRNTGEMLPSATLNVMPSAGLEPAHYLFNSLAIAAAGVIAGVIIALFNYHLSKGERRYKVADSFCIHLENLIFEYFAEKCEEQKKLIAKKFSAYLISFMFFAVDKHANKNAEIQKQWLILLGLDNNQTTPAEALFAVARLRFYLAK